VPENNNKTGLHSRDLFHLLLRPHLQRAPSQCLTRTHKRQNFGDSQAPRSQTMFWTGGCK